MHFSVLLLLNFNPDFPAIRLGIEAQSISNTSDLTELCPYRDKISVNDKHPRAVHNTQHLDFYFLQLINAFIGMC